ncbi:OmpA family protein [Photobacterium angustum]|uniref:OmpA family protein n=1 Tax=Photobacterium angustum TaxID=661 RepID=A0ABX5H810_PHOAN|nr:OmpA family protein [Photobacterium angustum]PSX11673.1 OmpA family protein [Photobacterium angustum]
MKKLTTLFLLVISITACSTETYVSSENINKFDDLTVKKFLIAELKPKNIAADKKIFLSLISHFDFDKSILKPDDIVELDEFISKIKTLKGSILITGNTDYQGSDSYNEALSMRRSSAIKKYLTDRLDVENYDFTIKYFGEKNPIAKGHSLKANALNRRGLVMFTES